MIHGKITRPVTAKISQLFSQRQAGIRFIGAAKLPFKRPASDDQAESYHELFSHQTPWRAVELSFECTEARTK